MHLVGVFFFFFNCCSTADWNSCCCDTFIFFLRIYTNLLSSILSLLTPTGSLVRKFPVCPFYKDYVN